MLDGIAISLTHADDALIGEKEPLLRALSVGLLPRPAKERFSALFHVKRHWTISELVPCAMLHPRPPSATLCLFHS